MIYLLWGPDTYRSRALLKNIVDEFKKKTGSATPAVFRFDAEENDLDVLLNEARSRSFFATKRLFVIERLFNAKKNAPEAVESFLEGWQKSKDDTFIFWDAAIPDSSLLFSLVKKRAEKTQEFFNLSGARLRAWLDRELRQRGITLSPEVRRALVAGSQGDLWKLAGEIDKCEVGGSTEIGEAYSEIKIWDFTDSFFLDKPKALAALSRMLRQGVDELYLLGAFYRTLRSILALRDISDKGGNLTDAGKKLNLHPYVFRKQTEIARGKSLGTLAALHCLLLGADLNIKTGKLPAYAAFLNIFVKS